MIIFSPTMAFWMHQEKKAQAVEITQQVWVLY